MAVDFTAWATNPDADRVLLVDVQAYTGTAPSGSVVTRYLSTQSAGDFQYYDPCITETPVLSRRIDVPFGTRTRTGYGFVEFSNADGAFDSWVYDSWGGRSITLKIGDITWSLADFEQVFTGVVDRLEIVDDVTLRLHIRDRLGELDKPIQDSLFTTGDAINKPKPLCFGACYNVTPVQTGDRTYQVHDGAVQAITAVYVDGVVKTLTTHYTVNTTTGVITFVADASGTVTADVQGATAPDTYNKPGEIVEEIVTTYGGLAAGDLDTAAFTAFDTVTKSMGLYIPANANILDALDSILGSFHGYYGITRAGKFTIAQVTNPASGTSVLDLDTTETHESLNLQIDAVPRWRTIVGYKKNWTILTGEDVPESNREWLESGWIDAIYTDTNSTNIQTQFLDALPGVREETLISNNSGMAVAEATARQGLFNRQQYTFTVAAFAAGYLVDIGDVATITDDRFDLASKKFLIVGIDDDMVNNTVVISGWFTS